MSTGYRQTLRKGGTGLTFLHAPQDIVQGASWDINTLEPPRLTLRSLVKDLSWEAQQVRASRLGLGTICGFFFLRILQRVSYNGGWHMGGRL